MCPVIHRPLGELGYAVHENILAGNIRKSGNTM